jgi:hypothetical protein
MRQKEENMSSPFDTMLTSVKAATTLYQFIIGDFGSALAEINQTSAKKFMARGEYTSAKTLLQQAYDKEAKPGFLKVFDQMKLYKLALSLAVCYQAAGQTLELKNKGIQFEDVVEDYKKKALTHLDKLKGEYEGWAHQTPLSPTGNPVYNYSASKDGLEWVAQQRKDLPDIIAGVKKLK